MSLRPGEMSSRAWWKGLAGRIWPAGHSLETLSYTEVHLQVAAVALEIVLERFNHVHCLSFPTSKQPCMCNVQPSEKHVER